MEQFAASYPFTSGAEDSSRYFKHLIHRIHCGAFAQPHFAHFHSSGAEDVGGSAFGNKSNPPSLSNLSSIKPRSMLSPTSSRFPPEAQAIRASFNATRLSINLSSGCPDGAEISK